MDEIEERLGVKEAEITRALGDERAIGRYRQKAEAAKIRAQLRLSKSAEAAARKQAELLAGDGDGASRSVSQRAAKDILDRAGVGKQKDEKKEIRVTFSGGTPKLGMPKR